MYFLLSKSITKQSRKGFQCAVHEVQTGTECERKTRTKENLQKYKKKKDENRLLCLQQNTLNK